jgi:large subunit ribosomal protein L25
MDIELKAQKRTINGKKTKQLRRDGLVPAVIYTADEDSQNIQVNAKEFTKAFEKAGHNTLVDLDVEGKSIKVLIEEVQLNPRNRGILHAMLKKINLKEEIDVDVPVEHIGESDAVKIEKGVIVTPNDIIQVRCLPTDIPASIQIDLSKLKTIGDSITIADVKLPKGVALVHEEDGEKVLVTIAAPQKEEIEEAPEATVAPEDIPASEEKGKAESSEEEKKD